MALLYLDGFDEYNAIADISAYNVNSVPRWGWVSGSFVALNAATFKTTQNGISSKSLFVAGSTGFSGAAGLFITPATGTLIAGFHCRPATWSSNFFGFTAATSFGTGSSPTTGIRLFHNATGQIALINNSSGATLGTTAGSYPINAWYHIQVKYVYSATVGSIEVLIDGVSVISVSGIDSTAGAAAINMMYFQCSVGSGGMYIDDVYLCDGTGSTNNNYLGAVGVYTLVPNAAGTTTQLTVTGAASNYLAVDEVPANTTDYVTPTASGQYDTYNMSDLTGSPTFVAGVLVKAKAQRATINTANIQLVIYSAGNTSYSSTRTVYTSLWVDNFEIFETQPGGAAWDLTSINAMEAGVKGV